MPTSIIYYPLHMLLAGCLSCIVSSNAKDTVTTAPLPAAFQWGLPYPQITSVLSFSQICQVDQCSPGPAPAEVF